MLGMMDEAIPRYPKTVRSTGERGQETVRTFLPDAMLLTVEGVELRLRSKVVGRVVRKWRDIFEGKKGWVLELEVRKEGGWDALHPR